MRNVPWNEVPSSDIPSECPYNECVKREEYVEDMTKVNSRIINIGSVAEHAISMTNQTAADVSDLARTVTANKASQDSIAENVATSIPKINADIAAVTASVKALEDAISEVEEDTDELSEAIGHNTESITILNTSLGAMRESVLTALSGVQDLTGKTGENSAAIANIKADLSKALADISNISTSVSSLAAKASKAESDIAALDARENADIASVNSAISGLQSGINTVDSKVTQAEQEITSLSQELGSVGNALSNLASKHDDDVNSLTNRINSVGFNADNIDAKIDALEDKHNSDIDAVNARINSLSTDVSTAKAASVKNTADIANLQTKINDVDHAVDLARDEISTVNNRVTALSQRTDNLVANALSTARDEISTVNNRVTILSSETAAAIADLYTRIDEIEQSEPAGIISFKAVPDICETGGSENIVLTWELTGDYKKITINDTEVTGNTVTMPNIRQDTDYTLKVTLKNGGSVTRTVSVKFVNHIYWGVTSSGTMTKSVVKGLNYTDMTDKIERDITYTLNDEYAVYAYPKRLGNVSFEVSVAPGGFEAPVTVTVDNHSEYIEDYYVYRSTQKLTGEAIFKVRKI